MIAKCCNLLEASSLPGVPILIRSRLIIKKVICLLFTLLLLGLSIKFINYSIRSYYNHEVVTNINVYHLNESQFPAVSFCLQSYENKSDYLEVDDFIVYCRFDGDQCNGSDFEIVHDPSNRKCYRFNSVKNATFNLTSIKNAT